MTPSVLPLATAPRCPLRRAPKPVYLPVRAAPVLFHNCARPWTRIPAKALQTQERLPKELNLPRRKIGFGGKNLGLALFVADLLFGAGKRPHSAPRFYEETGTIYRYQTCRTCLICFRNGATARLLGSKPLWICVGACWSQKDRQTPFLNDGIAAATIPTDDTILVRPGGLMPPFLDKRGGLFR